MKTAREFSHNNQRFQLRVVDSLDGVMIVAFCGNTPVSLPYSVTKEVRNDYYDTHHEDILNELLNTAEDDIKRDVSFMTVREGEAHTGPTIRVLRAAMGNPLQFAYDNTAIGGIGFMRKPDRLSDEEFQQFVDDAEIWASQGRIQILHRHNENQSGELYTDLIQFKRLS